MNWMLSGIGQTIARYLERPEEGYEPFTPSDPHALRASLKPADVLTPTEDAGELVAAEPEVLAHMNEDHAEACRLYATKLLGAPDGAWRCVGCDPEGLELQLDRMALRLPFPQRVRAPGVLRVMLKQLAEQARAA